jgi:hypothetical protein
MLLGAATRHTGGVVAAARDRLPGIEKKYFRGEKPDLDPRVYLRLTDNWIELSLRYLAPSRGSRAISDAINRDVLREMTASGIPVASETQTVTVVR